MNDTKMIAQLEARAAELEGEAARYREAAAVLRGSKEVPKAPVTKGSTAPKRRTDTGVTGLALAILEEADHPLSPRNLASLMFERGWKTESTNPTNLLRTSLRKLVVRGEVAVTDEGAYFALASPSVAD